jgi:putative nucleotidyltransferase with HDIG domain
MILKAADTYERVLVKDMGFGAQYLLEDEAFLDKHAYKVIFLIRNPHPTSLSFYKKINSDSKNIPTVMSYKKIYELFQLFSKKSVTNPLVIIVEELTKNPRLITEKICNYLDITFSEEMLSWNAVPENFSVHKEWVTGISEQGVKHWYDNAFKSTHITTLDHNYALDNNNQPTFEEIKNPEHRDFYKAMYDENMPYYKLFLQEYEHQKDVLYDIAPTYEVTPENVLTELQTLYREAQHKDYIGEKVSQLEHALQAAQCALTASTTNFIIDEDVIIAALLHDIGHAYTGKNSVSMDGFGVKNHELIGAEFLRARGFSEKICALVAGHVDAKRYKAFKNPEYSKTLSYASQQTLLRQGGIMTQEEAAEFEQNPYFDEILFVRWCDEQAKVVGEETVSLDYCLNIVKKHLQKNC